jgi:hypothetical protein
LLEFDWIFDPEGGRLFIETLANSETETIFEVEPIKQSILFMWQYYFK